MIQFAKLSNLLLELFHW